MKKLVLMFTILLYLGNRAVEAQYVINAPTRHKQSSAYRQQFMRSSSSSSESTGQTEFFEAEIQDNVKPSSTSDIPFVISDSYSRKSSSSNTTFEINNIFPKDSVSKSTGNGSDKNNDGNAVDAETGLPLLALQTKDLSSGALKMDIVPSKEKIPLTTTSASFSRTITETFSLYAESSSPNFVNSFSNVIFNKNYLGK